MASERPLSNKELCAGRRFHAVPLDHIKNRLSPVKGEFEGGRGGRLIWYTLSFHHLRRSLLVRCTLRRGQRGCLLGLNWKDEEQTFGRRARFLWCEPALGLLSQQASVMRPNLFDEQRHNCSFTFIGFLSFTGRN